MRTKIKTIGFIKFNSKPMNMIRIHISNLFLPLKNDTDSYHRTLQIENKGNNVI